MKYRVRKKLDYKNRTYWLPEARFSFFPKWFKLSYGGMECEAAWKVCKDHSMKKYNDKLDLQCGEFFFMTFAAIVLIILLMVTICSRPL